MAARFVVTPELIALAGRAQRAGLGNGVDFYVRGVPFSGALGADLIGLSYDGSEYCVEHRGSDRTRDLLRTADVELAGNRFLAEAERLAATFHPRRAHRPDPERPRTAGPVRGGLITVLQAVGIGFAFGLLVIPALVLLVVVAVASGSYDSGGNRRKHPWRGEWDQKIGLGVGTLLGLIVLAVGLHAWLGHRLS